MKAMEVAVAQARRVYGDIVKRRSTVRVVTADENPELMDLAFVLGLYRSGTTALRYSLSSHPAIASPPETDFLDPLLQISLDPRSLRGIEEMGFGQDPLLAQIRSFANYFYANYAQSLGASLCVDKTPRYTFIAEELLRVFPNAKSIALFRNPFGQVRSITDGLRAMPEVPHHEARSGEKTATAAARYWVEGTRHLVRSCQLYSDQVLPVPYEALSKEPEPWLRAIVEHLGLEWDAGVLTYDPSKIDSGNEGGKAAGHRSFVYKPVDISSWAQESIDDVSATAGSLAESIGYDGIASNHTNPSEFKKLIQAAEIDSE